MGSNDALPISGNTVAEIVLVALLGMLLAAWLERAEVRSVRRRSGYLIQAASFVLMTWAVITWWSNTRWDSFEVSVPTAGFGLILMIACLALPSALNEEYEER